MINSSEITVILKGLIIGKTGDKYSDRYTYRSIESVRKYLPDSKIILSTWEGSDVSGLSPDEIIFNKDPGKLEMVDDGGVVKFITVNNQIITSQKGLEKVCTKYTLLMRTDMILTGIGFLKYFEKYNKNKCEGHLNKKIVVLPTYSPRRVSKFLFDTCDWVYFGLTEDLKNIFQISLIDKDNLKGEKKDGYYQVKENLGAEQYVWLNFLKKYRKDLELPYINYFSEELNDKSEESYARNTIMISATRFCVKSLKYPNSAYGALPWKSAGLYTLSEYNKIYNKYNKDKIFYIRNYFEEFIYYIQMRLRFFIKNNNQRIYKKIVNFIRRYNGNRNLFK